MSVGFTPWIELDQSELNQPTDANIRGAKVEVMVPPQDFPVAARGYFSEPGLVYVIEFKYGSRGQEPLVVARDLDRVRFMVGKDSGRLLQICISMDGATPGDAVQRAIAGLRNAIVHMSAARPRRNSNYRATQEILSRKGAELAHSGN